MNPHQKNKVDISVSYDLSTPGQAESSIWLLLIFLNSLSMRRSKNFSVSTESCPTRRISYRINSKSVALCSLALNLRR